MKIHLTLVSVALAALAGCGTMDNRNGVDRIPPDAFSSDRLGVIILSTGAPKHCISEATFVSIVEETSRKVVPNTPLLAVDVYVQKSEFSDHHGTVNAVTLLPGTYYLSPLIANPFVVAITVPNFRFEVKPGETTYLGELFMPRSCGMNTSFVVRDEYERDIRLASAKNSSLNARTPVKRLMQPVARQTSPVGG